MVAKKKRSRRASVLRRIILLSIVATAGLLFLALAVINYSLYIEPNWIQVTRHEVPFENYPAGMPPLKIVQLSDPHIQRERDTNLLRKAVRISNGLDPDVVVITGDFVHQDAKNAIPCARELSALKARYGVYAVLGNHDYWTGGAEVTRGIEKAGVRFLVNDSHRISDNVWLIGIDDLRTGFPNTKRAFRRVPLSAVRIVISHNPRIFREISDRNVLLVTGHTHGGQIVLPTLHGNWNPHGFLYVSGWYREGNSRLYVNRGLGGVSARFRCRPEVTEFIIERVEK
jgi:uncharacterized protein